MSNGNAVPCDVYARAVDILARGDEVYTCCAVYEAALELDYTPDDADVFQHLHGWWLCYDALEIELCEYPLQGLRQYVEDDDDTQAIRIRMMKWLAEGKADKAGSYISEHMERVWESGICPTPRRPSDVDDEELL